MYAAAATGVHPQDRAAALVPEYRPDARSEFHDCTGDYSSRGWCTLIGIAYRTRPLSLGSLIRRTAVEYPAGVRVPHIFLPAGGAACPRMMAC